MEAKKRGSAILMVILIITVITTISAAALKINGLIGQLVIERAEHQKKQAALEALALYGIALGYRQLQTGKESQEPILKKFDKWPLKNSPYQGQVAVSSHKNQWQVQAQIGQKSKLEDSITALISPTQDGWEISQWNYGVK